MTAAGVHKLWWSGSVVLHSDTHTHTHTGERCSPSITCWCGPQRLLAAHALYLWLSLENTSPPAKEWGREFRNLKKEGLLVWNKYTFVQYRERERDRADVGQRRQLSFNNCGRLCCWCRPGYCAFWLTLISRREADRKGSCIFAGDMRGWALDEQLSVGSTGDVGHDGTCISTATAGFTPTQHGSQDATHDKQTVDLTKSPREWGVYLLQWAWW